MKAIITKLHVNVQQIKVIDDQGHICWSPFDPNLSHEENHKNAVKGLYALYGWEYKRNESEPIQKYLRQGPNNESVAFTVDTCLDTSDLDTSERRIV